MNGKQALSERKKYITYAALAVVIIGLILIVGSFIRSNNGGMTHYDSGVEEDVSEPYAVFENQYQLEYSVSKSVSNKVFAELYKIVTDADEIASAPHTNQPPADYSEVGYRAELVESSVSGLRLDNGVGIAFDIAVSDGRAYKVYVRTDQVRGVYYYAMLATRTEPSADTAMLSLTITSKDTDYFDRETTIREISDWAKTTMPGKNIYLTVHDDY
ncbi:hypothetical protein IKE79_01580 [Candidatus Saccharibacteria bacterium]|nr:hypothetical protein [Candidatus Saccharibacteria bacterium]